MGKLEFKLEVIARIGNQGVIGNQGLVRLVGGACGDEDTHNCVGGSGGDGNGGPGSDLTCITCRTCVTCNTCSCISFCVCETLAMCTSLGETLKGIDPCETKY